MRISDWRSVLGSSDLAVDHVAAAGRAHGEVAARAIDFDVARTDRADRDAAADIFQVEVARTDRTNLYRTLRGADRHVARADAADPRRTADVADGGVAGTDRVQGQRPDVDGFQVAGAQRCGQFAAPPGCGHRPPTRAAPNGQAPGRARGG